MCLRPLAAFSMGKNLRAGKGRWVGEWVLFAALGCVFDGQEAAKGMAGMTSCCYSCRDERGKWVDEWVAFPALGSVFDGEGPDRGAKGAGEVGGWVGVVSDRGPWRR